MLCTIRLSSRFKMEDSEIIILSFPWSVVFQVCKACIRVKVVILIAGPSFEYIVAVLLIPGTG